MASTSLKSAKSGKSIGGSKQGAFSRWSMASACAFSGAILGLSAPGIDQWYVAWFGLVPLCLLVVSSPSFVQAFFRGFVFGTAYNLVYLNWYLGLHPLSWLGFSAIESMLMAGGIWLVLAVHQGLIIGSFAAICRLLPLTGSFLPGKVEGKWCLPAFILIPLLWVIIQNKLGNAHDFLGVPWSMIEYSQYKQVPVIQIASLVGGIGVGCLIVLANVVIASLIATMTTKLTFKSLAAKSLPVSLCNLLVVALFVTGIYAWGLSTSTTYAPKPTVNLAVLQANLEVEKQKCEHPPTISDLLGLYGRMLNNCPQGICIWAENALPTYLKKESTALAYLTHLAAERQLAMVVGSLDRDKSGKPFSSAYGINSSGTLLPDVYHKRYLVPFGEYMPRLVEYLPECLQRLTCTAAGKGLAAGDKPVVWPIFSGQVAPLVCFEAISPEIVSSSVRKGGTLLVNISDLCWFHNTMIGQQMLAFSVLRAVESRRYFVFACNTGPSAVISPTGKITNFVDTGKQGLLISKAAYCSEITPFTWWFR
jgi:apolipoprotein N-acyltransferase